MPAPYYVSTGAWGSGLGRPLHVAEFDGNTYSFATRLSALEAAGSSASTITNITVVGNLGTIYLADGTTFTFTMPQSLNTPAEYKLLTFVSGAYTLIAGDANCYLRSASSTPVTITIPADADVALSIGTEFHFRQGGAGAITVAGDSGVTLNAAYGCTNVTIGQGATITVKKVAADAWDVIGGQLVPT